MVRVEELFDAAREGSYDRARSLVSAFGDRAKDVVNQPDRVCVGGDGSLEACFEVVLTTLFGYDSIKGHHCIGRR